MEKFYFLACRRGLLLLFSILCSFITAQVPKSSVNSTASSVKVESVLGSIKQLKAAHKLQPSSVTPFSKSGFDEMSGKPEAIEKRDAFSKHYRNPDGSYTAVVSSGEVNYRRNGQWQEINTAVTSSARPGFAFENTTNSLESFFGKEAKSGVISKTEKGEVTEFLNTKMYWEVRGETTESQSGLNGRPESRDNRVYYKNLFPEIDAEFIVSAGKRKLNYIIADKTALAEKPTDAEFLVFSEDILLPAGWTHKINAKGDVEILDVSGALTLIYAKPTVEDSYGAEKAELKILDENPAGFTVRQSGNVLTVLVKVKADWLFDDNTQYPVAVDPTVNSSSVNAISWTGWSSSVGGNEPTIFVGKYSGGETMAGFAKFDLTNIPGGSTIISASSVFRKFNSNSGSLNGNRRIDLRDIPVDPVVTAQTSYASIIASSTMNISNDNVVVPADGTDVSHNLNSAGIAYLSNAIVQGWVAMAFFPSGSDWTNNNYGGFRGYDHNRRPFLTITYTPPAICEPRTLTLPKDNIIINDVSFLGTINSVPIKNLNNGFANGYQNFTSLPQKAVQVQGKGINVLAKLKDKRGKFKAWVDWNKNGVFEALETIYDTQDIATNSVLFGFVVPPTTVPGDYRIRIRAFNRDLKFYNWLTGTYIGTAEDFNYDYNACEDFMSYYAGTFIVNGVLADGYYFEYGEAEDYLFTVIADCAAKITAVNVNAGDGKRCGAGSVNVSATGPAGATFKLYSGEFDSAPIHSNSTGLFTLTNVQVGSHTYWVTATAGGCESVVKTPLPVMVSPVPTISFTMSKPSVCGDSAMLSVTSAGDKEEVTLFYEKFSSGLGLFKIAGTTTYPEGNWKSVSNPYQVTRPPYFVQRPALSSGYNNGNFATAITDLKQSTPITKGVELTSAVNASQLTNIKLDFDLYYQSYADGDATLNYFKIKISTDNGSNWTDFETFTTTQGDPGRFLKISRVLPATCQVSNLKIAFESFSFGGSNGWIPNLANIDNIRLYGDKALNSSMNWTSPSTALYNSDCSTPYSGATSQVCIKPTPTELENIAAFNLTATATLTNGCSATGTVNIQNTSKIWNQPGLTDWNAANWKPASAVPDATKCVIIKTPIVLTSGADGLAKNLTIIPGGSLAINSGKALTVTDFIKNEGAPADLLVNSDANLLQLNDTAVNTGAITVKRNAELKRLDYNYWGSPVAGQTLKAFSPGTLNNRFYTYRESDDMFDVVTNPVTTLFGQDYQGNFVGAPMGYAIRASNSYGTTPQIFAGTFTGLPNNGVKTLLLKYSGESHGFNLVGNPYPSNFNFYDLYAANSLVIYNTAYFWTNVNPNPAMQGSNYNGANYAVLNGIGGVAATTTHAAQNASKVPSEFIKVGQGFIVKAQSATHLKFNNAVRTNVAGEFFNRNSSAVDRFWLKMTSPYAMVTSMLIGYKAEATNGYEPDYDSPLLNVGSDALFSVLDDKKLAIQGRAPFVPQDKVPLGTNHYEAGDYTLTLERTEGIFADSQNIYLKDLQTGLVTNLSEQPYTFTAGQGLTEGRFEILYEPQTVLSANDLDQDELLVYRDGDNFVVKTNRKNITAVEVFDSSGRLIHRVQPAALQAIIPGERLPGSVYFLKIMQGDKATTRKIIR